MLSNIFANSGPTGDETLTESDATEVLEELLPAQNQSFLLGLKLKLPINEVENIHKIYSDPSERLYRVIIAFLRQIHPRPTWRVIVEALRSPMMNLNTLANAVEAAHFPVDLMIATCESAVASVPRNRECKCTSSHLQIQSCRILPLSHLNQLVTTVSTRPEPTIMFTLFVT